MSFKERLEQLEASHVELMTEHEVEAKKNDRTWKRHRRFLREYEAHRLADDARWTAAREEQRQRDIALDKRITDLVLGIGKFMAKGKA